jgi:hypothetical protein
VALEPALAVPGGLAVACQDDLRQGAVRLATPWTSA